MRVKSESHAGDRSSMLANLACDVAGACTLLVVALAIGLIANRFRQDPLTLVYKPKEARIESAIGRIGSYGDAGAPVPVQGVALPDTVDIGRFEPFVRKKEGIVLDARAERHYRLGHVPGALRLSPDGFEKGYAALRAKIEPAKRAPVVVYCSSAMCEDSALVQKALRSLGFTNVAIFRGGWAEWRSRTLPVETSD